MLQLTLSESATVKTNKVKRVHYNWASLTNRLAVPLRTKETMEEYNNMDRDEQGVIKDVGGFVGGVFVDNIRKKANVISRGVLALDADNADENFLEKVEQMDITCLVYSTHSHTAENPKYRLIIPLSDQATPVQYTVLVNWFVEEIGWEYFDPTCEQPERLMYWPSCSSDAEYVFHMYSGKELSVEEFFDEHTELLDESMHEMPSKRQKEGTMTGAKVQDPTKKTGLVGAFCRTFSISELIDEYLTEIYAPVGGDRYTYIPGSTSGGAIVYEDKWMYSHHGSDPGRGKLLNAWDLMRIHKFDGDDTEMWKFAAGIGAVHSQWALEAFSADFEDSPGKCVWVTKLKTGKRGIAQTITNVRLVMENDEKIAGKLRYNELAWRPWADGSLPWRSGKSGYWADFDTAELRGYLEKMWGLSKTGAIDDAFLAVTNNNRFNPVQEYLKGLKWDGVPRLEQALIKYMGAEDSEYVRTVTTTWMVGAVARAMRPGCQYDYMLILVGDQNLGKSAFLRALCGEEWFTESLTKMDGSKESVEGLSGKWIVNIDELAAMNRSFQLQENIKNYITRTVDSFRQPYGRFPDDRPRRCVFSGTSNTDDFLKDVTGNRRFWPVRVTRKPIEVWSGQLERDQLWAEAYSLWEDGMPIHLDDRMIQQAMQVQEDFTDRPGIVGQIEEFLLKPIPKNYYELTPAERRNIMLYEDSLLDSLLDLPLDTSELISREFICTREIYVEFMGHRPGDFDLRIGRKIDNMLKQCRCVDKKSTRQTVKGYGQQRVHRILL